MAAKDLNEKKLSNKPTGMIHGKVLKKLLGEKGLAPGSNRKVLIPSSLLLYLIDIANYSLPFDEDWYLESNKDISDSFEAGKIDDAHAHFINSGYFEGRTPTKDFNFMVDEEWYLNTYPDVKAAVSNGTTTSAREHFFSVGYIEGRHPNLYSLKRGIDWTTLLS